MNVGTILADSRYSALKEYVVRHTGLAYYAAKDEDFATRLSRRFTARGLADCGDYLEMLTDARCGRQEMDQLVGELTIGETYFFRHKEQFDLMRTTIIPDLLERNKETRSLRIWSAGCATGPEPYSVSVLLRSEFQSQLSGWNISIVGTDLNLDFLQRARAARFPDWALRDTSERMKARCFLRDGNTAGVHERCHLPVSQPGRRPGLARRIRPLTENLLMTQSF